MMFLGTTFFSGNLSIPVTATDVNNITYVELDNGMFDDLYITKETTSDPSDGIVSTWDFDTMLNADFDEDTSAGNVNFTVETVSQLVVRRRELNTFDWTTVCIQEINNVDDFNFDGIDRLARGGTTYQYAVIPYLNRAAGSYNTHTVTSEFDRIILTEKDTSWSMFMTDGFCDTTRNIVGNHNELLNRKYPIFYSNSIANYDTGSCTGTFVELDEETCTFNYDTMYKYQHDLMDYITDGKPKVLKHFDGRIWLIQVTPSPTDSAQDVYNNRSITFDWVEIGDYKNDEDLYNAGLTDIPEEWWL